jgi:hypothetical protein
MSMEANCLNESSTNLLRNEPTVRTKMTDITGTRKIKVCKVDVGGVVYWANQRTGTLYDTNTGRSMTGSARIDLP